MPGSWEERFKHLISGRYVPAAISLTVAVVLCIGILQVDKNRISEPAISLVKALIWPTLVTTGVLFFRKQAETLLTTLNEKIAAATAISFGKVSIQTDPNKIPVPASDEAVTLDNVALLHTSFLRPDKTRHYNNGLEYYQIEVVVIAPDVTLDRITSVTYYLDPSYPKAVYKEDDRKSKFKLRELANGTSIVRAELNFSGQQKPLVLNRFIDLRPTGPRI